MFLPGDDAMHTNELLGIDNINGHKTEVTQTSHHTLSTDLEVGGVLGSPASLEPSGSWTYSFQESTFGRRLHRACTEAGYVISSWIVCLES